MLERILIAGSGGQGVLLIGRLLAQAGVETVPHVTYFPAYGAEVRGGTSNCQTILSDEEINSPVSEMFETMLIMNEESMTRFLPSRGEHTLVILNTSLCDNVDDKQIVGVKATDIANELGEIRSANFVMLGAYLARHATVPVATVEKGIRRAFKGRSDALIEMNIHAFQIGLNAKI